jgi:hypothetical protein
MARPGQFLGKTFGNHLKKPAIIGAEKQLTAVTPISSNASQIK